MLHAIVWPWATEAARVAIEDNVLVVTGGVWPDFGDVQVLVASATVALESTDAFVLLDRDGGIVVVAELLAYGAGGHNMVDLLAWRENSEWHVKRLVAT